MPDEVEKNKNVQSFYQKAKEAFDRNNFDYAQSLLKNLLISYPDFQKARSLLRVTQIRRMEGKKDSGLKEYLNAVLLLPLRFRIILLISRDQWTLAIDALEKMFQVNPSSVFALRKFSECAAALNWNQAAIDALEILKKTIVSDVKTTNSLAHLYAKIKNLEKSRKLFEEVLRLSPSDPVALRGLKDLAAMKTIEQGGWTDTTTYRQKIRDESGAEILEKGAKLVKTEEDLVLLIEDIRKKLETQPENIALLKELAKLLEQNLMWDEAIAINQKLSKLISFDASIQKKISDLLIQKINSQMMAVKSALSKDSSNVELLAQFEELKKKKKEIILIDCKDRVEHFPNNLLYRYELGYLYFELGQWNDAIQEFQQAVKDPQKRTRSLYYLGLCFKEGKFYDLAEKQFLKVLDESVDMDPFKKDVIYNLGLVYEATKQTAKATAEYKKIFEVDIAFKDVAQKIQKTYE